MIDLKSLREGDRVRAFDPRTLGVVRRGTVEKVGRKFAYVDFGLTGKTRVVPRDILGNESAAERNETEIAWLKQRGRF